MITEEKKCSKCKVSKFKSLFYKNKKNKDGLCYECTTCQRKYREENEEFIKEKRKIWYQQNKFKISEKYHLNKQNAK